MFQILDGIFQHDLVVQAVLEGVSLVLFGEVGGIKEIIVAPLLVGGVAVPEAASISMENSRCVISSGAGLRHV